jgi:hypothetical protein
LARKRPSWLARSLGSTLLWWFNSTKVYWIGPMWFFSSAFDSLRTRRIGPNPQRLVCKIRQIGQCELQSIKWAKPPTPYQGRCFKVYFHETWISFVRRHTTKIRIDFNCVVRSRATLCDQN